MNPVLCGGLAAAAPPQELLEIPPASSTERETPPSFGSSPTGSSDGFSPTSGGLRKKWQRPLLRLETEEGSTVSKVNGLSLQLESPEKEPTALRRPASLWRTVSLQTEEKVAEGAFSIQPVSAGLSAIAVVQQQQVSLVPGEIMHYYSVEQERALSEAVQLSGKTVGARLGKGASGTAYLTEDRAEVIKFFNVQQLMQPEHRKSSAVPVVLTSQDLQRSEFLALCQINPDASLALPKGVYVYDPRGRRVLYMSKENIRKRMRKYCHKRGFMAIPPDYILLAQVSRRVPGKTLYSLMERGPLEKTKVFSLARKILRIMQRLHEQGVLHRDLNPTNLILTPEGEVVAIDWGTAFQCAKGHQPKSPVGARGYRAPETYQREQSYGLKTDSFVLGALIYRMTQGKALDLGEVFAARVFDPKKSAEIQDLKDEQMKELLVNLLATNPEDRWTLEQADRKLQELLQQKA